MQLFISAAHEAISLAIVQSRSCIGTPKRAWICTQLMSANRNLLPYLMKSIGRMSEPLQIRKHEPTRCVDHAAIRIFKVFRWHRSKFSQKSALGKKLGKKTEASNKLLKQFNVVWRRESPPNILRNTLFCIYLKVFRCGWPHRCPTVCATSAFGVGFGVWRV